MCISAIFREKIKFLVPKFSEHPLENDIQQLRWSNYLAEILSEGD